MFCHDRKLPAVQVRSKITHAPHDSQQFLFCTAVISLSSVQGMAGNSYKEIPSYFPCEGIAPRLSQLASVVRMKGWLKSGYFNTGGFINFPFKVRNACSCTTVHSYTL